MRYSESKNSATLKTGLVVVQGHWNWCRSIDHIVTLKFWLEVTQDYSDWYHLKAWLKARFPICLP